MLIIIDLYIINWYKCVTIVTIVSQLYVQVSASSFTFKLQKIIPKKVHHKLAIFQVPSTEAKMFDGFIKPWMVDIKKDPARPQATASSNPTPSIMLFAE